MNNTSSAGGVFNNQAINQQGANNSPVGSGQIQGQAPNLFPNQTGNNPVTGQKSVNQPTSNQGNPSNQPASNQPALNQPALNQPALNQPGPINSVQVNAL